MNVLRMREGTGLAVAREMPGCLLAAMNATTQFCLAIRTTRSGMDRVPGFGRCRFSNPVKNTVVMRALWFGKESRGALISAGSGRRTFRQAPKPMYSCQVRWADGCGGYFHVSDIGL